MRFVFPYHLVDQSSKILLYGCGECGKEFWLQLHLSKYCNIVAWVDSAFDGYELNRPFDYVRNIPKYNYDHIVVAVSNKNTADIIIEYLLSIGVDRARIIWSNTYSIDSNLFPVNKFLFLKDFDFYTSIIDDAISCENFFAGNRYYQGIKELGIKGNRNDEERVVLYRIPELLSKEMSVLDMGCNYGFFDLLIAPYVKRVTGIDIEPAFIRMAKKTADYLHINNADFLCADVYKALKDNKK